MPALTHNRPRSCNHAGISRTAAQQPAAIKTSERKWLSKNCSIIRTAGPLAAPEETFVDHNVLHECPAENYCEKDVKRDQTPLPCCELVHNRLPVRSGILTRARPSRKGHAALDLAAGESAGGVGGAIDSPVGFLPPRRLEDIRPHDRHK